MDYATLLLAGYKQAGPFEIGPVSTFYSFNPVEGFKPKSWEEELLQDLAKIFIFENYLLMALKIKN